MIEEVLLAVSLVVPILAPLGAALLEWSEKRSLSAFEGYWGIFLFSGILTTPSIMGLAFVGWFGWLCGCLVSALILRAFARAMRIS